MEYIRSAARSPTDDDGCVLLRPARSEEPDRVLRAHAISRTWS